MVASRVKSHPWLAAFFAFGALMCTLTIVLLVFPGTPLDTAWRVNPDARVGFKSIGNWSVLVMAAIGMACALAALGLCRGARWGIQVAMTILSLNLNFGTIIDRLLECRLPEQCCIIFSGPTVQFAKRIKLALY